MKLAIGSDHGGIHLKELIIEHLRERRDIEVLDFGCKDSTPVDFPLYAEKVAKWVVENKGVGILCCGTGIGMSIAANKISGARASVVNDSFSAKMTRRHNDSNIICLGERTIGSDLALMLLDIWLENEFEGGRHTKRMELLANLET